MRRTSWERLRRALAGDLDTIILKALAKEPTRRYHSVEQLADDLRRHLVGEPVMARPDSFGYRTSKFVRRHRIVVGAAAVVVTTLIGGVVAAGWQATVASQERTRAQLAQRRTEGVAKFVIDLFSGDDGSVDVSATTTMLDYGVRQAEDLTEQPEVQAETFEALARAYYNLARYREAADLFTRAYQVRDGLFPEGNVEVARSLTRMSDAVGRIGLGDSNLRLLERAWEMEQRLGSEADRARLETLIELGRVARGRARLEESDSILRVGLAISDRAVEPDDPLRAGILHQLVMTARRRREFPEAESLQREALAVQRSSLGADHPAVAYGLFFLGDLLFDSRGDLEEAEAHYREGLRIVERSVGPESKRLVHGLNSLAYMLARTGREGEAVELMRRGVHIAEAAYGQDNIATARERETLAGVLFSAGRTDEAESIFLQVLDHKRELLGEWTVPGILFSLSQIAERREDLDRAEQYATEAVRIQRESGVPSLTIARSLRRVANIQVLQGDHAAAEGHLLEALALSEAPPSREQEVEASYLALSQLYGEWGRPAQAATYLSLARGEPVRPASSSQ
jgi:serine/threonine-protein kinase